jgi:ATP synthase protein I
VPLGYFLKKRLTSKHQCDNSFCEILHEASQPVAKDRTLKEDTKQFLKELFSGGYQASSIGFALVFAIAIGGGLGYWLSQVFDNMLFFYLGLIIGIIAGFRNLYIIGKRTKM